MIGTLAALFFAIGFLLTMASASLIEPLAEAITKCRERVKEAEDETSKIKLELEEKNEQLQLEYENKIALLRQEYETKLSENLKSLQTAEQNKNAKSEYAELCEKEKQAFEFVLNQYNSFFSNTTRKLLEGIEIGRLHNYFDRANDYYFTDFSVIVHNKQPKKNQPPNYTTTLTSCDCYDFEKNHVPACKHMLFLAYSLGILQIYREKHKSEFDRAMRKGTLYSNSDKRTDTKNQTSLSDKTKKSTPYIRGSEEIM